MDFPETAVRDAALNSAQHLGYKQLKDLQMQVVVEFVKGHDVFALLPTGYGKSLCYACLPILYDKLYKEVNRSIVVVVTPLTAIMQDQVS